MLTTPNLASCLAISAGRHQFGPPIFTARRPCAFAVTLVEIAGLAERIEFSERVGAIRDSRIAWGWAMNFQMRRTVVRREGRSSAAAMMSLSERLYDWRARTTIVSQSEATQKLRSVQVYYAKMKQGHSEPRHLARDAITAVIG
jgi:hypothetical protein